jgi:hypothetical protein
VGSRHGGGRRTRNGGLRLMLEEEEHRAKRAQGNGGRERDLGFGVRSPFYNRSSGGDV